MRRAFLIAVAAVLLRLPLASLLNLSRDEAYYWVWSQHPALSYYDHPPMVAWLVGLSCALFGKSELAVRLPALVCGPVTTLALAWMAHQLAPEGRKERAAVATALLSSVMLLAHLNGFVITPDALVSAFWAVSCALLVAALRGRQAAWYGAGAMFGLALLSKYTAVLTLVSLAWLAAVDADARRALACRQARAGAALAALLFLPVIAWNMHHGWASFAFQMGGSTRLPGGIGALLEFVASQAALLTPMLLLLVISHSVSGRNSADPLGDRFLTTLVWPPFLLFAAVSLRVRPEANWPGLAHLAAAVIGGLAWARARSTGELFSREALRTRRLFAATMALCLLGTALLSVHALHPLVRLRRDRLVWEFHGWPQLAAAVRRAAGPQGTVLGDGYQVTSEIAFYSGLSRLGVARRPDTRLSMFDWWGDPSIPRGGDALYVALKGQQGVPNAWACRFVRVESLPPAPPATQMVRLVSFRGTTGGPGEQVASAGRSSRIPLAP